jgi:hypothetical protein
MVVGRGLAREKISVFEARLSRFDTAGLHAGPTIRRRLFTARTLSLPIA